MTENQPLNNPDQTPQITAKKGKGKEVINVTKTLDQIIQENQNISTIITGKSKKDLVQFLNPNQEKKRGQ